MPGWRWFLILLAALAAVPASAQQGEAILLRPARVFDGVDPRPHEGWQVLVRGDRIEAAGPGLAAPPGARVIELPGMTLMPGLIEGHAHLFLHPYNETSWDDQVLREPLALRTARAVAAARTTLMAGFTTVRDLGTEGAGYADVGLRDAIARGIVPGPRMLVATRALVATGAYGPKLADPEFAALGAEEADGPNLVAAARQRGDRSLFGLERRGARARIDPDQARQLRRGAGGGRRDVHGRRRRRLRAWRKCARDGADGGLGDARRGRADRRHLGQCAA